MAASVDLLRHGDTGQAGFRGLLDDALTSAGWAQMREAVAEGTWDAIVASPLRRCADFAHALAQTRGLPLRLDPRWREYDFGQWQAVPVETLAQTQPDALARFWSDPEAWPPPGAEPMAAFASRVRAALDDIAAGPPLRVLVITHGGPIRLLRCAQAGWPLARISGIEVAHASLHRLAPPDVAADRVEPSGAFALVETRANARPDAQSSSRTPEDARHEAPGVVR